MVVNAGGHVSGGHYNPAVSTSVFVRGELKPGLYVTSMSVQFFATSVPSRRR
jgi:aquaporin Z